MKILIYTQTVDIEHPVLGFFHRWIEEFAKRCEIVHVVCLWEGIHTLPPNVHVHSLGKEDGVNHLKYLWRFYKYTWQLRHEYDVMFVHMIPQYAILGWLPSVILKKPMGLWYMHKSTGVYLRTAEKLVDAIFTASKESFRIPSKKLHITGHGIDTDLFTPEWAAKQIDLLTVGRITPSKNLEMIIEVLDHVRKRGHDVSLTVIGKPTTDVEHAYYEKMQQLVTQKELTNRVHFLGGVPHKELPQYLAKTRVFVHAATNGSLDKALLEPLASGVPLVTSAEGAASLPLGEWHVSDTASFADRVIEVLQSEPSQKTGALVKFVQENHSIQSLIPKVMACLKKEM